MSSKFPSTLRILLLLVVFSFFANAADTPSSSLFPIDGMLKKRFDFWVMMYTELSTHEGLVHDAKYPHIVYEKLDFDSEYEDYSLSPKMRGKRIQHKIDSVKTFYKNILLSLEKKSKKGEISVAELSEPEKRLYEMFKDVTEPSKYYKASHTKRMRFQVGQKDRFLQGYFYSGRYLPLMEKIFKEKGIPPELTRLPFVESSFNLAARSKVGASGIWQFMRSTGRLYLKINDTVDERNDPIRATEAAAELLKLNYESLRSWPLAITAYNHGRKGLMRAVRKVGSEDLDDIIEGYRSRTFGFASSNFYTEFLAAASVEKDAQKYFGNVEKQKTIEFAEFVMNDYVSILDISTYTRIPLDTLSELNPALTDFVFKNTRFVPAGYVLRVPIDAKDTFLARYSLIPANKKLAMQVGPKQDLSGRRYAHRGRRHST